MARQPPPEDRSVRLLKVGERVRHVLSELLTAPAGPRRHADRAPRSRSPKCACRPTCARRAVYVKPLLGGDEEEVLTALRRNTAFLQREVAQRLGLKFAPKLKFLADESFDEAERIERLLTDPKVARDSATWARLERSDGQALFLLRQHERRQIDQPAAGQLQLRRARDGDDAVDRGARQPLRASRSPAASGSARTRAGSGRAPTCGKRSWRSTRETPLACVLIDEAQFLTATQVWQCARIADEAGIPVLCYGLQDRFPRRPVPRLGGAARDRRHARRAARRCATAAARRR